MRGDDPQQAAIFSHLSPEERVPTEHPLRAIRAVVDGVLTELSCQCDARSWDIGRPSMAPEKWLQAWLRPGRYTMRRERLRLEQLGYNILCRWCVELNMNNAVWDSTVFSQHRERLLAGEVGQAFFDQGLAQAREHEWLSDEPCTVDGTLREAWAGQMSLQRKELASPSQPPDDRGNPSSDVRGTRRPHATQTSTTDPGGCLYKKAKGQEAQWSYLGHVRMDNRHGLVIEIQVTQATGTAERGAALAMAESSPGPHRVAVGADKNDDTRDCVRARRELRVTPHVAQHTTGRASAIDGQTARHLGDAVSQRTRTCVEEVWGWLKTVGRLRQVRQRGVARVGWMCTCAAAAYNWVRTRPRAAVA